VAHTFFLPAALYKLVLGSLGAPVDSFLRCKNGCEHVLVSALVIGFTGIFSKETGWI
jgi:hypothetical protein